MDAQTHTFPNDSVTYITPSWQDMEDLAFDVAQKMQANNKQVDRIVTLAKGGWPMTRSLVDFLKVPEVASIGVKFYKGINQRMNMPEIYQDLPVSVTGERVLLFDDVADTGESLEFTKKYLLEHGVAEVTTATLYFKPHSQVLPDYYAAETSAWIIFPYDAVEMLDILGKKWQEQGCSKTDCQQRFATFGFSPKIIETYFS